MLLLQALLRVASRRPLKALMLYRHLVRAALSKQVAAAQSSADPLAQEVLYAMGGREIRARLGGNQALCEKVLWKYVRSESESMVLAAAQHGVLTEEMEDVLLARKSWLRDEGLNMYVLEALAKNTTLSSRMQEMILTLKDGAWHYYLAENSALTGSMQERVHERGEYLHRHLARNQSLSPLLQVSLAESAQGRSALRFGGTSGGGRLPAEDAVASALVGNPVLGEEALQILARDPSEDTRARVAWRSITAALQEELSFDPSLEVRRALRMGVSYRPGPGLAVQFLWESDRDYLWSMLHQHGVSEWAAIAENWEGSLSSLLLVVGLLVRAA